VFLEAFEYVDIVGVLVSEEMSEIEHFSDGMDGAYAVMIDPVDGSSNIDVNGIIGSIFAIHALTEETVEDSCLKPGHEQVAAGYIMYGPSTVLVYTARDGVHAFILDPYIGEFVLQEKNVTIPDSGSVFSANLGYYHQWDEATRSVTDQYMAEGASLRYSGALLADLHAILHRGGVYYYPATEDRPEGKLRLLYECNPLALIAEQAGGAATNGATDILELEPDDIHERTPLFIGSRQEVERFRTAYAEQG
jgi:fructose-1,6-bisphosphatase I